MSIKSILCAYSGDVAKGSGLRHAIRLAKRHEAHLMGVAKAAGRGFLHRHLSAQLPPQVIDQLDQNGRRILAETEALFQDMVSTAGLAGRSEFLEMDPKRDGPVAALARAFDLVVIGHHHASIYEDDYAAHPDLIALRSGRPVLIVPDGFEAELPTQTKVTVAWDGKRAATRAVVAAMPLLEDGAEVTLLSVGEPPRNTARLADTLGLHGIAVEPITVAASGSVADTILSHAMSQKADLIVMGAFEHSKFSHDVIGGATTDVLEQSTVPVLMAH